MSKFKMEDRVAVTAPDENDLEGGVNIGDTGTITDTGQYDGLPMVRLDRLGTEMVFYSHQLTVINGEEQATSAKLSKPPVTSIVVPQTSLHDALTTYVKDTFGFDLTVTKIRECYEGAMEIVLKDEAA